MEGDGSCQEVERTVGSFRTVAHGGFDGVTGRQESEAQGVFGWSACGLLANPQSYSQYGVSVFEQILCKA